MASIVVARNAVTSQQQQLARGNRGKVDAKPAIAMKNSTRLDTHIDSLQADSPSRQVPKSRSPTPKAEKKTGLEFITDGVDDATIDEENRSVHAKDRIRCENSQGSSSPNPRTPTTSFNQVTVSASSLYSQQELSKYYRGSSIIDPRKSKFMPMWDVVMLASLLFTALVTPYEVTFIEEGACVTILFVINRLIDLLFFIDICLIFNTAYQDDSDTKPVWVYSRRKIAKKYLNEYGQSKSIMNQRDIDQKKIGQRSFA